MIKPENIEIRHLFPELYSELIESLRDLKHEEWNYKTSSTSWNVKDIVAHLVDTDLRRISFQRDNLSPDKTDSIVLIEISDITDVRWILKKSIA